MTWLWWLYCGTGNSFSSCLVSEGGGWQSMYGGHGVGGQQEAGQFSHLPFHVGWDCSGSHWTILCGVCGPELAGGRCPVSIPRVLGGQQLCENGLPQTNFQGSSLVYLQWIYLGYISRNETSEEMDNFRGLGIYYKFPSTRFLPLSLPTCSERELFPHSLLYMKF